MPRVRSELPVKGLCGRGQLLETHLASGGGSGAGAAGRWSACLESVEPERRNSKGSEELERRSGPGQGPGFPSSSGELVLHS